MKDLIERQAAIDALTPHDDDYRIRDVLEDLPSAQPGRKVFEGMSDAEFEKWLYEHGICNPDIHESIPCEVVPLLIDDAINELPAQPERKRGKWIEDDDGWDGIIWRCSECNAVFALTDGTPEENEYNFCPHCGADMRKDEQE